MVTKMPFRSLIIASTFLAAGVWLIYLMAIPRLKPEPIPSTEEGVRFVIIAETSANGGSFWEAWSVICSGFVEGGASSAMSKQEVMREVNQGVFSSFVQGLSKPQEIDEGAEIIGRDGLFVSRDWVRSVLLDNAWSRDSESWLNHGRFVFDESIFHSGDMLDFFGVDEIKYYIYPDTDHQFGTAMLLVLYKKGGVVGYSFIESDRLPSQVIQDAPRT